MSLTALGTGGRPNLPQQTQLIPKAHSTRFPITGSVVTPNPRWEASGVEFRMSHFLEPTTVLLIEWIHSRTGCTP